MLSKKTFKEVIDIIENPANSPFIQLDKNPNFGNYFNNN